MPAAPFPLLQKLVKKFTGRAGLSLTLDESKIYKEKYPEEYKEYLAARREYNAAWKAQMASFCEGKPHGHANYVALRTYLAKQGFPDVLPDGFTGLIDAKGDLFTTEGEPLIGKPTIANFPTIRMNPTYGDSDDNWVCQGIRADGTKGPYFYTKEFKQQTQREKFEKVKAIDLDAIRRKWLPYVKKFDITNAKNVGSVVLEMLYQFTARIGTPGNSTFGMCTIQVRHVHEVSGGLTIRYLGKDSVTAVHKLVNSNAEHKPLIKDILELIADKSPKEQVFTVTKGARRVNMSPAFVNKLWKANGGGDTTVHKIRTTRGTKLFYDEATALLAGPKRPKTQREAVAAFKVIAEKVGKLLNHVKRTANGEKITGATALKSYIDASLQVLYWHELGYPLPKYLQDYENSL